MNRIISFRYRNWRGETATRRVLPQLIYHGSNEYHTEPQWLMLAYDLDRKDNREFALSDCDFTHIEGQR